MLKQGVEAWNAWRDKNQNVLDPNLREADLRLASLIKVGSPDTGML